MEHRASSLDGLRGFAAVAVVFHHAINICDLELPTRVVIPPLSEVAIGEWPARLATAIFSGSSAVNLFFVLSGAVLMASLLRETPSLRAGARFTIRRILRLYPALIVSIVAFAVASRVSLPWLFGEPFSFAKVAANCLLLDYQVNGATWTLQIEMILVPIILLVALLYHFLGPIAIAGFVMFAVARLYSGALFGMYTMALTLPCFAFGALIPTDLTRSAVARFPAWSWAVMIAAIVTLQFAGSASSTHDAFAAILLSYLAVAVLWHKSPGSGVLAWPFPRFLGRISYSLYLWHGCAIYELFPALQWAFGADRVHAHYLIFGLLYGLAMLAICIPISMLSERWVERPFIELSHRFFRSREPVVVVA